MRPLAFKEKVQRGCFYCIDRKRVRTASGVSTNCPYDECPYHVLDKYETYEEYVESEDSKIEALMH